MVGSIRAMLSDGIAHAAVPVTYGEVVAHAAVPVTYGEVVAHVGR